MKFYDVSQNSDRWFDLRKGKLTGSACSIIMANYIDEFSDDGFGEPAKNLAVRIALEQITGLRSVNESFTNSHMDRGHKQEPAARLLYEEENFVTVTNGGFFDDGNTGCSPDGLVDDDGVIEIKSVLAHVHYENIERGYLDPTYKWQFYFNLLKTNRQWLDSISYCADFPEETRLFTLRLHRKDCREQFKMINHRTKRFFSLVDDIKKTMTNQKRVKNDTQSNY